MARAILIGGGTVFAAAFIRGWLAAGNEIAEIWCGKSGPLARAQRTATQWAPNWSVHRLAERHGLPVFRNEPLKKWGEGASERASALDADTLVTCVTMQIVPRALIEHFAGRAVNFHPAMLPAYRGPSPLLGVLIDGVGHLYSGVTLHELSPGIDEGAIIAQRPVVADGADRRHQSWMVRLAEAVDCMARDELPAFLGGRRGSVAQSGGTYRRVREEAGLGPHLTFEAATRVVERAGASGRISAASRAVKAPLRRLSDPTGAPPVRGPLAIDIDLADARVRVARWTPLDAGLGKLDMLREMRAADRRRQE